MSKHSDSIQFPPLPTCNEARETSVSHREAGVAARESTCRDTESGLHARWASVDAERVQVENQRA